VFFMKKVYNIVMIGCGHMGAAHLDEIYYRDNISIKGVVDLDENKAKLFCRKYGSASYSVDYKKYLDDPEVDIVIISTYASSHLELLKDCIKAGKHVLCEKPITDNLEDGKEFVNLVNNSKTKVLVGHILRHNESYKKIGEMIHSGAIGHPIIMRMVQNHHTVDWKKYLNLIKETSPIIDCGVHYIDVMRWFTNADFVGISGISQRTEPDVPIDKYNYGMITAKLSDGSVAYYEAGWGNSIASSNIKEFIGPKGRISLTYRKDRLTHQEEGDLIEFYKLPEKSYETINIRCDRKPTAVQLNHLIDMIENNVPAVPKIEDVYQAFYIAIKADEAIKNCQYVSF
jgi:predicted dehydrogenase